MRVGSQKCVQCLNGHDIHCTERHCGILAECENVGINPRGHFRISQAVIRVVRHERLIVAQVR